MPQRRRPRALDRAARALRREPEPAEKLNLLQTIQGSAKRMSEMIDDVLTLAAPSRACSS